MSMRITAVRAFAANHERQIIVALVIHGHYKAQVGLSRIHIDTTRLTLTARILAPEDEDEDAGSGM